MKTVSPSHTKRTIAVPPDVEIMPSTSAYVADGEWDEYMIFLVLERQRFVKLKELYKGSKLGISGIRERTNKDAFSLKLPPRYQCRDFSAGSFLSEMQKQHQALPNPFQHDDQWKSGLDEATLTYLADLATVLNDRYSSSQTRSSTPLHFLPLSSNTITPPSTPLLISLEVLDISPLSLGVQHEGGTNEVDLSDEEIMSLWSCTLPSDDGVDFDMFQ